MARRRRDADTSDIASDPLPALSGLPQQVAPISFQQFRDVDQLTDIEDRRRYHPEAPFQAPLSFSGLPATIGEPRVKRPGAQARTYDLSAVRTYPAFDEGVHSNGHAVVCVRRKSRREVMFAKRLYRRRGRGAGRRNYWSEVKC